MARRRKRLRCGWCRTADAVEAGMRYGIQRNGVVTYLPKAEALDHLASLCKCEALNERGDTAPSTVSEIRREGSRILRQGTLVYVQLKRRPGTSKTKAVVDTCYADGTVRLALPGKNGTVTVPADEYVTVRNK